MDFESPDVEKDFPGLYASESGRKSNESDFSDGAEHDKPSKKDLLGRRKDKKEKKDRGYAALEGESSPEEDTDTKSPSKSKKTKSFKFPSKSKEKREKSRDKEKVLEEAVKHKEHYEKEKKKEKEREKEREKEKKEKERKEKERKEKLKEKDKVIKEKEEKAKFKLESKEKLKDEKKEKLKEKDKDGKGKEKEKEGKGKEKEKEKVKEKDKDRKDKKLTKMPSTVTSGIPFEEIFTLGVALPIFGVPLQQSVERSRCHDDTGLPLVVRDSIDFLQDHGLKSNLIYRSEPDKVKLQQLRKLYTDRGPTFPYHWDVPVACAMLKSFISELPESILTQEFHGQFEQATAMAEPHREATIASLLNKLPSCNLNLLSWLIKHFEGVIANEQVNHVNIQTIITVMGPALNMSSNLITYLITKADKLFPHVRLTKYVPPLLIIPADFPDSANEISSELRKQESLLNQIHAEMHAGVISSTRDQQLWEAQRIVTQLKRKLRMLQKSAEPHGASSQQQSIDEKSNDDIDINRRNSQTTETSAQVEPEPITPINNTGFENDAFADKTFVENKAFTEQTTNESPKPQDAVFPVEFEDNFEFKTDKNTEEKQDKEAIDTTDSNQPTKEKPKLTEKELKVLRLELENAEYLQLKSLLQAKINSEQFEIVKLRSHVALKNKQEGTFVDGKEKKDCHTPEEHELKQRLVKENAMLEQKRLSLINQIFQERVACVQLKIDLAMNEIVSKS